MKNTSIFFMAVLVVGFIGAPVLSIAATTTPSWGGFINEGSNESNTVRQERIRGWRQQSSDLQQKIDLLGSTAVTSVAMPVLFGVAIQDISPNFGDPRSGGRTHEGEDIMATDGTPIVSPTPAVVLRTGSGSTEGNYVYTANPGGETFVYM
ncbi:MAG: M23 family metallopeptidase, partial [Candidatus Paceibacterota bacterium]